MLRIFFGLLFISSCSLGVIKNGGEEKYRYDHSQEYSLDNLKELAPLVVESQKKDPIAGKIDDLFKKGQRPLKRIGIIIFESQLQPTRDGLADDGKIFLTEQGKQLITEKLFRIWEQGFNLVDPQLDYVKSSQIKKAKSFSEYGNPEEDHIKVKRSVIAPDDIAFQEKGKKTTLYTVLNPRGMRDLSLLLVPATELMSGPKWSEQNKHFVNDVIKELKLDAAILVMSDISWTSAHIDKTSGDFIPEEMKIFLKTTVLTSLSSYHERLRHLKMSETPSVNLCFRYYEASIKVPVKISVEQEEQNFLTVEKEILNPMIKIYRDFTLMTISRMAEDLKSTY